MYFNFRINFSFMMNGVPGMPSYNDLPPSYEDTLTTTDEPAENVSSPPPAYDQIQHTQTVDLGSI